MINKIKKLRKELHKYPELSGFEFQTTQRIKSFVELYHPTQIIENLGGNSLAVIYQFSTDGPSLAIRCELDALPIEESNQFDHRSTVKGVSHKCGHDGHMAIVAGLIFWIKKQNFKSGKIVLLFQSAEETGQGAYNIIEDIRFTNLNIDYIFALHNIPGESLNSLITTKKAFSAEVQSFAVHFEGKESHAAEPENGLNPALAISEIITALSKLNLNDPNEENYSVLTPVHINMGQKSYGISPAKGELHYTIRTWSSDEMQFLKSEIETVCKKTCLSHKIAYKMKWFEYFPAGINDSHCNKIVLETAKSNQLEVMEKTYPFKFGEDFGWFSRKYKVAMFGLGAGTNTPALHDAEYDFPDEIIEAGINMFKGIISKVLSR